MADTKADSGHQTQDFDRARLLRFAQDGAPVTSRIPVEWPLGDQPNDIEAACLLDEGSRILVFESGDSLKAPAPDPRIFELSASLDTGSLRLRSTDVWHRPSLKDQVEGVACFVDAHDSSVQAVLAAREYSAAGGVKLFTLRIGSDSYHETTSPPLPAAMMESYDRPISDLYLDTNGDLWATAVSDPGDFGPFRSMLYRLGRASISDGGVAVTWSLDRFFPIPGTKVEGITRSDTAGSPWLITSDDEAFGGLLRPIAVPN